MNGSFVSPASGTKFYVAVVAAAGSVRVYVCNGQTTGEVNEWFAHGSTSGNAFTLTSDSGAKVAGSLTSSAATGKVTLAGGNSFTFRASRAAGVAGLYRVRVFSDGRASGFSDAGGRVSGRISAQPDSYGIYPVVGTVTGPHGETAKLRAGVSVRRLAKTLDSRWIVLRDGHVKGGKVKSAGSEGVSVSFHY